MQKDNERCIRYVTKEMDPSEAMLLEQEMLEDEDLLIEVESMRRTLKKLERLPNYEPPKYLSEKIVQDAIEYQNQQPLQLANIHEASRSTKFFAAAAFILVGVVFIGMNFQLDNGGAASVDNNSSSSSSTQVRAAQMSGGNSGQQAESANRPWIDRQDILRYQLDEASENTGFDRSKMRRESLKKLTPLDETPSLMEQNSQFNLTNANISNR